MKSDLELLKGWGRKFDLHASQQAGLIMYWEMA